MNILLTGGAGYIGSHTAVVLAISGQHVVLYDNLCNSKADVVEKLQQIVRDSVKLIQGDVRDTALLIKTLKAWDIDAVFHFAGLKAVGDSVAKPLNYYANNVQGMISVLDAMQRVYGVKGTKRLVFSSSAAVYGHPDYLPVDEVHPFRGTNPYGQSKIHVEEMLADVVRADPLTWRIACLRYFNPVGAHASGLIGDAPKGIPSNLVPYILHVASDQLSHLPIYGHDYPTPDGTGIRDYIHVMDLAEGHLAALDYLCHQETGLHHFNLGTGRGYSVLEMVRIFEENTGIRIPYKMEARRPGDLAACYAKVDKALLELSWRAQRTMKDMMLSAWGWKMKQERCVE